MKHKNISSVLLECRKYNTCAMSQQGLDKQIVTELIMVNI